MEIVNGFQCKNCTDVDYAKKHIDPAHPKDGPYGVNAATNPDNVGKAKRDPAVQFGGVLAAFGTSASSPSAPPTAGKGALFNFSV